MRYKNLKSTFWLKESSCPPLKKKKKNGEKGKKKKERRRKKKGNKVETSHTLKFWSQLSKEATMQDFVTS